MSPNSLTLVRRHRSRFIAALTLILAAGAALVVVPSLASAAPSATVTITAGKAYMPTLVAPVDSAKYSAFVVKDVAFNVPFTTDAPLSTTASTKLTLTVDNGRNKGLVLGTFDLDPNVQQGEIVAASGLPTAANNVTLKISAKGGGVTPGTTTVDVVGKYVTSASTSLTGIGAGGGPGVPCTPTSTIGDQTCGDLKIPAGTTVPDQLLTQGLCTSDCKLNGGSVLQWLATVSGVSNDNPVVFVAKCDKSLCSGKGIWTYHVFAQTDPSAAPIQSPPCSAKGVVDQNLQFCTDYVQSTRDGAGDVLLVVLFASDAKIIW